MTKAQARAAKMIEENRTRREALLVEKKQLIKQGLLFKHRTVPGFNKNPRGWRLREIERIGIEANRAKWIAEHPGETPPWEKFSMG